LEGFCGVDGSAVNEGERGKKGEERGRGGGERMYLEY